MSKKAEINRTVTLRLLVGSSIALIALGVGNILFADHKIAELSKTLNRTRLEMAATALEPAIAQDSEDDLTLLQTPPSKDTQQKYIKRLEARIDFYQLVIRGGKCFLAVSGVLLLALLVLMSPRAPAPET